MSIFFKICGKIKIKLDPLRLPSDPLDLIFERVKGYSMKFGPFRFEGYRYPWCHYCDSMVSHFTQIVGQ